MRGAWWTYRWTACVILSSLAGSLAAEKSVVHELTEKDYDKFVADNTAFLISFTAPWCGHSRALRPEYEKAAHSLTSQGLPVTHVDGTENEALATRLDVKGYPTIFFVRGDATIEFDGNRKASELQRWALSKLKPPAPMLATEAEVDSWVKGKKTALVLFVGSGELDPALREAYLAVAAAVEQPCAMSSATGRISANAPALAMFKTFDGGAPVVMSGELSRSRMQTFAQVEALPLVVEYTAQVEDTLFASSIGLHVLLFYDGARPDLEGVTAAAKALRGEAVFSLIQASKHLEVGEFFDVQPKGSLSPPIALAFVLDDSTKYAHRGALDEPSLVAFVRAVQSGSATPHYRSQPVPTTSGPVVELVGSTYAAAIADPDKDVLVQLYSPDCGHCRKLAPVYEAVARKLAADGDMVVAQIDASANDIAGMEPEGFPTILFFPKANKKGVEYDGSRDEHDLVQFVADVREGRQHIGGLPDFEQPDEDAKVEL
jgi:protein disulfide-isomerase A1